MAERKKSNYTVKAEKKVILADVSKLTEEEIKVVKNYVALGYELKEKKKNPKSKTVAEMRADLKEIGEAELNEFNRIYKLKAEDDTYSGFHQACGYYNKTMKLFTSKNK